MQGDSKTRPNRAFLVGFCLLLCLFLLVAFAAVRFYPGAASAGAIYGLLASMGSTAGALFASPGSATLIVITKVINNNGGYKQPQNFEVAVMGNSPSQGSFNGTPSPGVTLSLQPGAYSVTQSPEEDYYTLFSSGCSGTLSDGQTITCTITNNDYALPVSNLISTCSGNGRLLLYRDIGNQQQPVTATKFTTQFDQLYIFFKRGGLYLTSLKVAINGIPAEPIDLFPESDWGAVYLFQTVPGDVITVNATSQRGAQGLGGFILQNSLSPVFNTSNIMVLVQDQASSNFYLRPGQYHYVVFDKYRLLNDMVTEDSRAIHVWVNGSSSIISDNTYTKPLPLGTQGAVLDSFHVFAKGLYTLNIDSEDSIYFPVMTEGQCPPEETPGMPDYALEQAQPGLLVNEMGSQVSIQVKVNNIGDGGAEAESVVRVSGTGPTLEQAIAGLHAGETFSGFFELPCNSPGWNSFMAVADAYNSVNESDEGNNKKSGVFYCATHRVLACPDYI